jgi:subtilisin family serine protease
MRSPARVSHVARLALFAAASIAAIGSLGAAAQDRAPPGPGASWQVRGPGGAVVAQGTLSGGSVALIDSDQPHGTTTLAVSSAEAPVPMLIRLHGEPLTPFLGRQRARIAGASGRLDAAQRAELQSIVDQRARAMQHAQQALIDALSADGRIDSVQRRSIHLTNTIRVTTRGKQLGALRADPRVQSVQPDHPVRVALDHSVSLINAPALWAMADPLGEVITGRGITVAIIDTGIDYRHPDLGGCIGSGCRVLAGHDIINDDDDPLDDHGHGTHVAGIAAANGVLRGVAPDASLLAFKVLDATGSGFESGVIAGLERAMDPDGDPLTDDQADVINMSLGSAGAPDAPLSEATDNAVDAGAIVVVAAGNSGPGFETIGSPGNAERAITVAASFNGEQIVAFSSRGPIAGADYLKPDLAAPGVSINSTALAGGYQVLSGTSMAAPHVAGAAALLVQRDPSLATPALRSLLAAGARDGGFDLFSQGAGRIDLLASTQATLLVDPPLLAFGAVDTAQPRWTRARSFSIRNAGGAPQAIALDTDGSLPAGAAITFAPAASFILAPGESRVVEATLVVDNDVLSYPDSESLSFQARIISTGSASLRLPLAFSKFETLTLEVENPPGWGHAVFLRRDGGGRMEQFDGGGDFDRTHTFRVRPGTYHALGSQWAGDAWSLVVKDGIVVDRAVRQVLSSDEAVHRLHVSSLIDEQGAQIADAVTIDGVTLEMFDAASRYFLALFAFVPSRNAMLRLSELPARYDLRASAAMPDHRARGDAQIRYQLSEYRPVGVGLQADWPLGLDARSAGKVQFEFADMQRLQQGPLGVQARSWLFRSVPGLGLSSISFGAEQPPVTYTHPIRSTVFGSPSALPLEAMYSEIVTSARVDDASPEVLWRPVALSGILGFPAPRRHAKIDAIDWLTGVVTPDTEPRDERLDIEHGGTFFASHFRSEGLRLRVHNDHIAPDWDRSVLLKDARDDEFPAVVPYRLSCGDSATTVTGEIGNAPDQGPPLRWIEQGIDIPAACFGTPLDVDLSMSVDVLAGGAPSQVRVRLHPHGFLWRSAPHLTDLALLDDGVPSRLLDGVDPTLRMRWRAGEPGQPPPQVTAEYRLDDQLPWQPLSLSVDADGASAALPVLDRRHRVSLRLTAVGVDGGSEQQTLESLFLLGSNTLFADGFERD